ncbi:MAG: hypothetical protein NTX77_13190 [Actinobacteria bacterium]|nr:hypothetical protein [Actinomycetota bacterium]
MREHRTVIYRLSPRQWKPATQVVVVLSLLVSLPLLVTLVSLSTHHWNPVLDLAMTEFRVRDVGTWHTPLIGLPGRIGDQPNQGSHPGPLSFYLLAPVYRLFGGTSYSLEVGSVLIHISAVAASLALAYRRGGHRVAIAVAAVLAVVLRGYGSNVLSQPWNPYLPLMAFVAVLLGVWSILEGDTVALIVVVVAGTLCMQTHVPYVGMVGGVVAAVLGWLLIRRRVLPGAARIDMPQLKRDGLIAAVVGVVLWLPLVADQVRHTPGNISKLGTYFQHPPAESIGLRRSVQLLFEHFNVFRVVVEAFNQADYFKSTAFTINGSAMPGAAVVLVWVLCAVQAWRLRHRLLIHLNVVIAVCLALAVISMSRIFGIVWYYLMFWLWSIVALSLLTIVWTLVETMRRAWPARSVQLRAYSTVAAGLVLVASTATFSYSAARAEPPEYYLSRPLDALVGPTALALDAGTGAATGRDGRYSVIWRDAAFFGSQGYGLLNELDRRGFTVGAVPYFYTTATSQRVIDPATATAEVIFATGGYVDIFRAKPGAVEVAYTDPRSPEQKQQYDSLSAEVVKGLQDEGLGELVPTMTLNLFGVQLDQRVPRRINTLIDRMLQLGQPTSVFIAPPGTTD